MSEQIQKTGAAADRASNTSIFSYGPKGWRMMIFSMFVYFTVPFLANDSLNIFVPILAEGRQIDPGILYSFNTLAGWVAIPIAFVFSWLLRKSSKICITFGLLAAIIGCLWFGAATKGWHAFAIMLLFQIAFNGAVFLGTSNLVANWFPTRKGGAMGWVTIGASLNTAINPTIWTVMIAVLGTGLIGLSGMYRVWAVVLAALLVFMLVAIKDNPEDSGAKPDNDPSISLKQAQKDRETGNLYRTSSPWTVGRLLACKEVWMIAIASGVIMLITMGIISNWVNIGVANGLTPTGAIRLMAIASVIGAIFSVIWGKVDAMKGVKFACVTFYCIMLVAMALWLVPSLPTLFIGSIFVGCSMGAGNNLMASMTASLFGRYDFDKAWGIIYPIHVAIRSVGFMLVGLISTRTGSFRPAFIVMMILAAFAILVVSQLKVRMIGRNHVTEEELEAARAKAKA